MNDQIIYMDAAHLTSAQWLKDNRYWCFRDEDGPHLVELPHRALTDFSAGLPSIQFHPDPRHLRSPSNMPRRYTVQRPAVGSAQGSISAIPAYARHVYMPWGRFPVRRSQCSHRHLGLSIEMSLLEQEERASQLTISSRTVTPAQRRLRGDHRRDY